MTTQTNLQPLNNRVIVQPKQSEQKTAGGIYIPDTAQEKSQEGTVVAVPENKDKCPVSVGDLVLYDQYAGTEITVKGETFMLLKCDDLLAKIKS